MPPAQTGENITEITKTIKTFTDLIFAWLALTLPLLALEDMISFQKSCRWLLTFATDPNHQKTIGDSPVPFRHAIYYYKLPIEQ